MEAYSYNEEFWKLIEYPVFYTVLYSAGRLYNGLMGADTRLRLKGIHSIISINPAPILRIVWWTSTCYRKVSRTYQK